MDPKLKALATEYEKARKQNLQLRQALSAEKDKNKSLTEEIEQLKNRPIEVSGGDDFDQKSQITRLQSELDQMHLSQGSVLRTKDEQISKLEAEVARISASISEPIETAEIGIQKDEEMVTEIDKDKVYQATIDNMKSEIESLKLSHQDELTSIMESKRLIQPDVILPKELNIIDQDELGTCESNTDDQLSSLTSFFNAQIHAYIVRLQNEIARAQYSSAESQAAIVRLRQADDERFQLIDQLRDSKEETKSIQAELETIKRSYEEQLNTMTEELAQQLNQSSGPPISQVIEEEKTAKKSRFSLFGRGSS